MKRIDDTKVHIDDKFTLWDIVICINFDLFVFFLIADHHLFHSLAYLPVQFNNWR